MSAAYRALISEGDRWLEQAVNTYTGGGGASMAAAEAAIASAYLQRAALEKPDGFASLVAMAERQKANAAAAGDRAAADVSRGVHVNEDARLAEAMGRHPAGKKRAGPPTDPNDHEGVRP